ncbi:hypothetical protein X773_12970 [Mesorhizobium sp. LSJC285A00]|nr:hypothetical protein X773_12970 [Mesorhizobium sp. LSJC285A00]
MSSYHPNTTHIFKRRRRSFPSPFRYLTRAGLSHPARLTAKPIAGACPPFTDTIPQRLALVGSDWHQAQIQAVRAFSIGDGGEAAFDQWQTGLFDQYKRKRPFRTWRTGEAS